MSIIQIFFKSCAASIFFFFCKLDTTKTPEYLMHIINFLILALCKGGNQTFTFFCSVECIRKTSLFPFDKLTFFPFHFIFWLQIFEIVFGWLFLRFDYNMWLRPKLKLLLLLFVHFPIENKPFVLVYFTNNKGNRFSPKKARQRYRDNFM